MSNIPVRREEITPAWLAEQLSRLGGCVIAALDHEEMTGNNPELSQLFRTRIEYAKRTPDHPDVVIVKIPPANATVRLREAEFGPFVREMNSYRILELFQGGALARMYSAVENPNEQTVCFVFEDLGPLQAGQQFARVDLAIAREAVEFMAGYQAMFWRDESLAAHEWVREADLANLNGGDPQDAAMGWRAIRDDDRFENTGGLVTAGKYLESRFCDLQDALRKRPKTLTHNDFHQGNILLRESPETPGIKTGPKPVIIDWQLTAYAGGTNDLAKFLMTAVPFEILAREERYLVEHYTDCLRERGVRNYSTDECWRDYRRAQVMVFANYAIAGVERLTNGSLAYSSGHSTAAVIRAFALVDPGELSGFLP